MKIIIADDHDLVRDALALLIEKDAPGSVVWHAQDFDGALALVNQHADVELVLLDVMMPGMDNLAGLRQLADRHPGLPVVMMSGLIQEGTVTKAFELGAMGFVPKTLNGKALVSVLNMVISGVRYVPDILLQRSVTAPSAPAFNLSPRELETLEQLAKGLTNKVIARELEIEETTVKLHLRSLFKKLGVQNRTEAVIVARDNSLIGAS